MLQLTSLSTVDNLANRIQDRTAKIGVMGLGYVGLPLAVAAAEEGFEVLGVDLSAEKVDMLNSGQSYVDDIPNHQIIPLIEDRKLKAFSDAGILAEADVVVICVPTPVNKTHDPDLSYIISATDAIAEIAHPGMLVILESTTYPGTTLEVVAPRLETDELIVGMNLFIAFSPERIDPGNPHYGIRNTPKVVGGISPECTRVAADFYGSFVEMVKQVSSTTTAETVKLLENTYRLVNIGFANEFAIMCDKMGIDVWEVIEAASTKPFGFTPFYPGPGLGGHCIPVDPHYLSWKLKTLNYQARFIEVASDINIGMPQYVINKVADALNDVCKSIRGSNIAVLGVAYKP
ncbi:MAG TPA: nucleotide sugar dehydrogenase, partial [Balneolales bacterium]|nr:nucleotide sugar dehydrogenase [Balneolales bacterium]